MGRIHSTESLPNSITLCRSAFTVWVLLCRPKLDALLRHVWVMLLVCMRMLWVWCVFSLSRQHRVFEYKKRKDRNISRSTERDSKGKREGRSIKRLEEKRGFSILSFCFLFYFTLFCLSLYPLSIELNTKEGEVQDARTDWNWETGRQRRVDGGRKGWTDEDHQSSMMMMMMTTRCRGRKRLWVWGWGQNRGESLPLIIKY